MLTPDEVAALKDHALQVVIFAPLAWIALVLGRMWGLLRFPEESQPVSRALPTWWQAVVAFLLYISVQLGMTLFVVHLAKKVTFSTPGIMPMTQEWGAIVGVISSAVSVVAYVLVCRNGCLRRFWSGGQSGMVQVRAFFSGFATWLVAYPTVMFIGHVLAIVVVLFLGNSDEEQVAVEYYRDTFGHPALLVTSTLAIGLIVPVVEEVLFRLLLQSCLRRRLSAMVSIVTASLIFSLFHYAGAQGLTNIQLLVSLFLFSLFLGLVYERWRTLWAPIGLHVAFNTISMGMVILTN